jgi:cell division protein FtsI/penicillin-binding protein 2
MSETRLTGAPIRLRLALIFICVVGILLGARLFYWQILQYDRLSELWTKQSTVNVSIPARRGDIKSQDGLLLATDVYLFTVRATPAFVRDHTGLAAELAPLLKMPPESILAALDAPGRPLLLLAMSRWKLEQRCRISRRETKTDARNWV